MTLSLFVNFCVSVMTPVSHMGSRLPVSQDLAAIRAGIDGNDVRKGWFVA